MSVVVFDPAEFKRVKPQFAAVSDTVLEYYFSMACGVVDNTDASPFPYDTEAAPPVLVRKFIIYALVCHLLTMDQQATNGQSGPVSSATEGSVSASFSVPPITERSYYYETACGRTFLALIRPYALGGRIAPACNYHPWG